MKRKKRESTSRSSQSRQYKTKIFSPVAKLIKLYDLDVRVGPTPKSVGIEVHLPPKEIAAYFGCGQIWLKDTMPYTPKQQQLVILHEIGHAIMLFWMPDGTITDKMQEINANAAALMMSFHLKVPVHGDMLEDMRKYTKTKGLKMRT